MSLCERHRLEISGAVQGVGYRSFIYRLAKELCLNGWVKNSPGGVVIEIEGEPVACEEFHRRLKTTTPSNATVRKIESRQMESEGLSDFVINESESAASCTTTTEIMPDLATCRDCLREIFDPTDRRYLYPFTNCTQCGPRFSIVLALPYDRERTTMRQFTMCAACRHEYESPEDRRFHAQPNACRGCGPQLAFTDASGRMLAKREDALEEAARAIKSGQIVAVKGIGGFHLLVDARSPEAISRLRERKSRTAKALAVMMPNLPTASAHCHVSSIEENFLKSAAAPIVILQRRRNDDLPGLIAPGNPTLGVMLPYTPLHHILMHRLGFPVVATSGNLRDEPICTDNDKALRQLCGVADAFLLHDRPIARPVDDSVLRVALGRELMLRRSRGYAPASISLREGLPPILAVGGDQKVAIAVTGPADIRCAQHIGDLESEQAQKIFAKQCLDFPALCGIRPSAIACDLHPGYHSSRMAEDMRLPLVRVQHHHAHIAACLAEHDIRDEVLGVAWDGSGYGPDGTIWGGEFLLSTQAEFRRFAWLRIFPLPGGSLAIRQPRYAALGLLHEAGIAVMDTALAAAFTPQELAVARVQLERNINTPRTSSAGRLFDAIAALTGLRWRNEFEAQSAMELEFVAVKSPAKPYPCPAFSAIDGAIDWEPMLRSLLADLTDGVSIPVVAARILETLSEMILLVAQAANKATVVLSGGCFQNLRLLETTVANLSAASFNPVWPQLVPPNDGGLAFGQAVIASNQLSMSKLY